MLEPSSVIKFALCALSLSARSRDQSSRYLAPYCLYGLVCDLLSQYVIAPGVAAVRPANGPMPPLGVALVGLNQWFLVTDAWLFLALVALAFRIRKLPVVAGGMGVGLFSLAMGVYQWVRADRLHRSFDAVLRVDGTSEFLGGLAALGLLVVILHRGFRSAHPPRLGVGHLVMMLQAAMLPALALLVYLAPSPQYDVRLLGLTLTDLLSVGIYSAAFATARTSRTAGLFTAST